ncbi:hypothetical protein XACN24_12765 [Xanthomonas albilineans]|uniref:Uncharacterized protein n=2 Tax=Xanthomonas albilineans TaxID=29447 RepID=D2UFC5_XANAP|nr:hypothetical protein [Xanthomonas albilineans]QHQ29331.1 hypothetical protein XaFJ1_GM002618 [Xanthomonas albilineans]CBA17086.1 hypothetical protein XALC_2608 [Xanthomonas albilineans GPE PC73]
MRGYTRQYAAAAAAIYHGLHHGDLRWVGLADRRAGIADDVVLGYEEEVIGHQFKSSRDPGPFRIATLLNGPSGLLPGLVHAWQDLKTSCPDMRIRLRVVVADTPSDTDRLSNGGTTRQFITEWQAHPKRSLAQWRATPWCAFLDGLQTASGLSEDEFGAFFHHLELVHGDQQDFAVRYGITSQTQPQVDLIANRLPQLVAQVPERERWTRAEFLQEMGWRDNEPRHRHQFPVGVAVQRNPNSEADLQQAVRANVSGYLSLVGPPGSGKSTLLQIALEAEPQLVVVRYLAFVPGGAQGIGRAESANFQEDLIAGLLKTGLHGLRFRRESSQDRREELETLLARAGERFRTDGVRTLVIIDGLDHVPREERPERSFLADLPLPASLPEGVLFVLGTQKVDLPEMPPAVQAQAQLRPRQVMMAPLSQAGITGMADALGLPPSVSRSRVRELTHGHPLATHYLLQALLAAPDETARDHVLNQGFEYVGDIDDLYAKALHGLEANSEILDILGLVARAEAPLDLRELEELYQPAALERAWDRVHHLLKRSGDSWSIFHNSFRLFLLRQEHTRYGTPDPGYSARLYLQLVQVARHAAADSRQHFLVARYLMRAGEHRTALDLATPALFRSQYLAGRAASEIRDDIRLAFNSLREVEDPTSAFSLILAFDEINRREDAFQQPDDLVRALLAIGQLNEAEDFLDEVGADGYLIVDAWLAQGNLERARQLFEKIEPLHDFGSKRNSMGLSQRRQEFIQWVKYAIEFRTPSELVAGIERIVDAMRREEHGVENPEDEGQSLREYAALATVAKDPSTDRDGLVTGYRLNAIAHVHLAIVQSAQYLLLDATPEREAQAAAAIGEALANGPALAKVPHSLLRAVALLAARRGMIDEARSLYADLTAPSISNINDTTDYESATDITRDVIKHIELAAWLGESVTASQTTQRPLLRRLPQFVTATGALSAQSRRDPRAVTDGEAARLCADFMDYVGRAGAGGFDEHFAARQLDNAAVEVMHYLLYSAARLGSVEFVATIQAFDNTLAKAPDHGNRHVPLQILVAETVAKLGHDPDEAERRLDGLLGLREEHNPTQFLASTARLAVAYANIGRYERARELIAQQRDETLGYTLPAKKDPQYIFWSALLQVVNRVDPAGRAQRVRVLTRQAIGMANTDGHDAAQRLAHVLVMEAAIESATLGATVAKALVENRLIEFAPMVDSLMRGTLHRDPTRAMVCVQIWVALCLPFHRAAYYREDEEAEFVKEAIHFVSPGQLAPLRDGLLENIVCHAQIDVRPAMLAVLREALIVRGEDSAMVDAALQALEGVAPLHRRNGYSTTRYDGVQDMATLNARLDADATAGESSYEASMAFQRLLPSAEFSLALSVFDRHAKLQENYKSRFDLVDRALDTGERTVAERLIAAYPLADDSARWSLIWGGGLPRYFDARLRLEGEGVHAIAYANFAASLVSGQEQVNSLLWRVDEIWPLLTASPKWAAMWATVEEQLPYTRDYRLGQALPNESPITDAAVAASLIEHLLILPVAELQWHAGRGALAMSTMDHDAFSALLLALLNHDDDSILTGLQMLLTAKQFAPDATLQTRIVALVDHVDLGIQVFAKRLTMQWGQAVSPTCVALPAFYDLALPRVGLSASSEVLRRQPNGPPAVSDPAAWSAPFKDLIKTLAPVANVSEDHMRWRMQQLIDEWGGVEAYGQPGIQKLQQTLSKFGLKITYFYPHLVAGLRALRHIAGELTAAGRIPLELVDNLLEKCMLAQKWTRTTVEARPAFVARPTLPKGQRDESEWLAQVEDDAHDQMSNDLVLAEITRFQGRYYNSSHYEWSRLRLSGVQLPEIGDPLSIADRIPVDAPVQRVTHLGLGAIPRWELTLNLQLVKRLGWRSVDERTWHDTGGELMATAYCWRDGGPDGELHDKWIAGEGAAIVLTRAGYAQLAILRGSTRTDVMARRHRQYGEIREERTAHASRRPGSDAVATD